MTDRILLVHLGGYASITAVLATANWAGLTAVLLALPIVLGALYLGGRLLIEQLVQRARRDVDPVDRPAATDGGQVHRETTTGSDRNRHQNR